MTFRKISQAWRGLRAFKKLPRHRRKIVFYSEGAGYWTYFEPVVESLRDEFGHSVIYVTSSLDDPIYQNAPEGLSVFYIGSGTIRTLFFATLDVDVLVMTMPDLQTFHIKRSPYNVHYVYLNHSMVSTHMVYRPGAFDHFDSFMCVGPHHIEEIRAREKALSLKPKTLAKHGYGRLDQIISTSTLGPLPRCNGHEGRVLIAPSWGEDSLIERHGSEPIIPLLQAGFHVVLRPHPQTLRLNRKVIDDIISECGDHPHFFLDIDGDAHVTLSTSDMMISDWSGAALEFSLGLERPVIFVDVPRKVLDPNYTNLGIEPLEARIRKELGVVINPSELPNIAQYAQTLKRDAHKWQEAARRARERWVYNVGNSGRAGATFLHSLIIESIDKEKQGSA